MRNLRRARMKQLRKNCYFYSPLCELTQSNSSFSGLVQRISYVVKKSFFLEKKKKKINSKPVHQMTRCASDFLRRLRVEISA